MALPLILSKYLRPYLRDGKLVIDNGVTSHHRELDPVELEVVAALWDPAKAEEEAGRVFEKHGHDVFFAAVSRLLADALVFTDPMSCDRLFDRLLDDGLPSVPFIDQVELTNHCPMKCQFCPRGIDGGMVRPKGFMELALFERLLAQLHPRQGTYRPLELHHLGESLLHPEVARFIALATAAGLPTEMSVNPSHLPPELSRALLEAGLRRIIVSLDGVDRPTLAAIRGPAANYEKAERNLDALLERVGAMSDPPRVVIQMIDLERNRHQREAFLERWGKSGLLTVTAFVKDLDGVDPDLGRTTATPLTYLCSYPWKSVVVLWDGRVVPCCRDADAAVVLGDLNTHSLAEIWHGPRARELRQHHRGTTPEGHLCKDCAWRREHFAEQMPQRHPSRAKPDPLVW